MDPAPPDPNNPLAARLAQIKAQGEQRSDQVVGGVGSGDPQAQQGTSTRIPIAGAIPAGPLGEPTPAFFPSLVQALVFPVLGTGLLVILGWIVGLWLYLQFARGLFLMLGMAGLYVFVLSIFAVYAYMGSWIAGISIATIRGAERMRGLPRLNRFGSDVGGPALAFFGTWIVVMLPYIVYRWGDIPSDGSMIAVFSKVIALKWGVLRDNPLDWILIIVGNIYLVAALPLVFATGAGGLHPKRVGLALARLLPQYVAAVLLVIGVFWAIGQVGGWIQGDSMMSAAIAIAIIIYGLAVTGRVLGLIYRCHDQELRDIAPLRID